MSDEGTGIYPPAELVERYENAAAGTTARLIDHADRVSERVHQDEQSHQRTLRLAVSAAVVMVLALLGFAWLVENTTIRYIAFSVVLYTVITPLVDALWRRFGWKRDVG